jgi:hypothetical protein
MLIASLPPALWFVHERIARLPTTTPLLLMNYDALAWLAVCRATLVQRTKRPSAPGTAVLVVAAAGLALSGLYLLTLIGLCGPAVLLFRCHA